MYPVAQTTPFVCIKKLSTASCLIDLIIAQSLLIPWIIMLVNEHIYICYKCDLFYVAMPSQLHPTRGFAQRQRLQM